MPRDVADDIVAEAFARVLAAIREGGGPDHAFRAYLLRAVRNLAHDWLAAKRRVTVIGDIDDEAADLAGRRRCGHAKGLRQAYLQEHIGTNIPQACRAYAGVRGPPPPRIGVGGPQTPIG